MWGVSCTHPMLASLCGEFLLHILCWLLCVGSFSYTSSAGFFVWGVSLTHPVLASLCFSYMYCASFFMWRVSLTHPMMAALCGAFLLHFHAIFFMMVVSFTHGEFLLHVPCWLYNVGSFSYISHAGCIMWGLSLIHI